ncbi:MAG: VCBS repeat-containing protein, partial [Candidatus Omnitrophica bacterium]|nr:VCBS repeat-containing protein [Candidatus Omnitrophota bacterium]
MACPHVAALAALLKAEYPSDPPDAIRARMMAGADNIGALNPGFESSLGEGRINAHRSLTAGPQPLFKLTGTIINNFRAGNDACLVIFLQNMWQDAFGLTATLSTDNPGAIIKNDTVLLGDIASGQTTSNSAEPFIISLNPGMVYGQTLELTLFLQCRGGYTKTVRVGKTLTGFSDTGAASNLPLRDMLPEQINMRDYDNDGYTDIFFTGWGGSDLYKNLKDGTFRKVTDEAKVGRKINSMGALFVDIDNDGDIDLFKEDVEESTL